jgi:stage III sporulation protein AB
MNLILCLGIVILCGYIGRQLSRRTVQRLAFFREYDSAMVSLADSITGMSLELCRALEIPDGETMRVIFRDCAGRLRAAPQMKFSALWQESFKRYVPQSTGLSKEDERMIASAGEAIEALCRNPSQKQAEAYLKRLEAYIAEMEIDKRKKCKLYSAGGILTGLFIALLVI